MRRQRSLAGVTALLLFIPALGAGAEPVDDQAKFQGSWRVQSLVVGGQTVKDTNVVLTFAGDRLTRKAGDAMAEATFKLDPAKDPKTIDFRPEGGATVLGIYKLDGDTLTMCVGEERPAQFASVAGSKTGLMVLKREKP